MAHVDQPRQSKYLVSRHLGFGLLPLQCNFGGRSMIVRYLHPSGSPDFPSLQFLEWKPRFAGELRLYTRDLFRTQKILFGDASLCTDPPPEVLSGWLAWVLIF